MFNTWFALVEQQATRGVSFGSLTDGLRTYDAMGKGINANDIAKMVGVSRATIYRYLSDVAGRVRSSLLQYLQSRWLAQKFVR